MELRPDVTLEPAAPAPDGTLRSRPSVGGRPAGAMVTGTDLAAAVEVFGKLLLFVAYGDPYEESLGIFLMGEDGAILDEATLGWMGATGRFGDLRLQPPSTVAFCFFPGRPWEVEVFATPRWILPISWPVPGVWRPTRWQRWFSIGRGSAGAVRPDLSRQPQRLS